MTEQQAKKQKNQWPAQFALDSKVTLSNGSQMPVFGLGTWLSEKTKTGAAVKTAIENGYIHVDCASIYANEDEVGDALQEVWKAGTAKRENIWVTSKVWNDMHHKDDVKEACKKTLSDLKLEYLDLYLIHFPVCFKKGILEATSSKHMDEVPLEETWAAMEGLVEEGLVKNIGLSNFTIEDTKKILACAKIRPVVNQYETQPYFPQTDLVKFCQDEDIVVTAHTSLGSPNNLWAERHKEYLMKDEVVREIADKHKKTPPQVLLRWGLQRKTIVIPKSITPERIIDNAKLFDFELTEDEMQAINKLDVKNYRFNHPITPWLGRGPFPDDVKEAEGDKKQ
eukprot:TRINITY_DN93947_c0_g1_i1.p2 TRINITY_DN93947_c0_g1~~TRINITY_DN93947_c0_g1_i1.p2  ORF type:complete len:347 (-),score=66.32 TRINITY_DN93947_c0_g1_i1:1456-2469(-)